MTLHGEVSVHLDDSRRIPPPDPDREPLKVNVYERMAKAAAELTPLFPYDSAGSIVPAGAVLVGGPDMEYGHFFHWNTVNEVAVTYGSNNAMLASGQVFVTQQLHGVNSFLRDEKDPDGFAVIVITQHQSSSGDQSEAVIGRCAKCRAELVRIEYDATPHGLPGYDAKRYGGDEVALRQFPTLKGSAEFIAARNSDEGRTCGACGHVNDIFPGDRWGWERAVLQTGAANAAHRALVEAAS
jgi:hypothetical protein